MSSAILGFERGWSTAGGVAASSPTYSQGSGALSVTVTNPTNELDLLSDPVGWQAPPVAGIGDAGATVALDLMLPTQLANPNNAGGLQLWISCPSRRLENVYLGKVDLKGSRLGIFKTVRWTVPASASAALNDPGWTDLTFHLRLHAPGRDAGTYVLDNLRVTSASAPPPGAGTAIDLVALLEYAPLRSTPGAATFPPTVVQVPPSFHVKLGKAGTGSATLDLTGAGSMPSTTCTYLASKDGLDYLFSTCTGGLLPGDLIKAVAAGLRILGGDPFAGTTKLRVQLAGNPAGDLLGDGVVPPMPTYWGDTARSAEQIATAFFDAVNQGKPEAETWIVAPLGDFAKRNGDGTPYDALAGVPPPVNDPPFDYDGHLNRGGAWDGYWRLAGNLSALVEGGRSKTHFQADLGGHAVLWGNDLEVTKISAVIDTDAGEVSATGMQGPSSSGSLKVYLFGVQLPGGGDDLTHFDWTIGQTTRYEAPPIRIWVFAIKVGVYGDVSLTTTGSFTPLGFGVVLTPHAAVGASVEGGVDLYAISGGVRASIDLLSVDVPVSASAAWAITTDPSLCRAELTYAMRGDAKISTLGGRIDLVATFGFCPLCDHEEWTIFDWAPLPVASAKLFEYLTTVGTFPLAPSLCRAPLAVTITSPAPGDVVYMLATMLNGKAMRPATPGAPERSVDCSRLTWTSNDPSDTGFPATGCAPVVRFGNQGPRVLTLNAADEYGEAGVAMVAVQVTDCPGGDPVGFATPCGGCGGETTCSGACSISTPTNMGANCGTCGTVVCGGACIESIPAGHGTDCGCPGGKIMCDGNCSRERSKSEGQSCGGCNGRITCEGTCDGPASCGYVTYVTAGDGSWGDWYPPLATSEPDNFMLCNPGFYANGYQLRSEEHQSGDFDDTALNAVRLLCQSWRGDEDQPYLEPHGGFWGDWLEPASCAPGRFMYEARLKIEAPLGSGADDTGANRLQATCRGPDGVPESIEATAYTDWGDWQPWGTCPVGTAICGIQVRVEAKQGSSGDDTALNGVQFACCAK